MAVRFRPRVAMHFTFQLGHTMANGWGAVPEKAATASTLASAEVPAVRTRIQIFRQADMGALRQQIGDRVPADLLGRLATPVQVAAGVVALAAQSRLSRRYSAVPASSTPAAVPGAPTVGQVGPAALPEVLGACSRPNRALQMRSGPACRDPVSVRKSFGGRKLREETIRM